MAIIAEIRGDWAKAVSHRRVYIALIAYQRELARTEKPSVRRSLLTDRFWLVTGADLAEAYDRLARTLRKAGRAEEARVAAGEAERVRGRHRLVRGRKSTSGARRNTESK